MGGIKFDFWCVVLFDGMGSGGYAACLMGRTGWTGYQKCPLKIIILCGYIDKVYTYLYMY